MTQSTTFIFSHTKPGQRVSSVATMDVACRAQCSFRVLHQGNVLGYIPPGIRSHSRSLLATWRHQLKGVMDVTRPGARGVEVCEFLQSRQYGNWRFVPRGGGGSHSLRASVPGVSLPLHVPTGDGNSGVSGEQARVREPSYRSESHTSHRREAIGKRRGSGSHVRQPERASASIVSVRRSVSARDPAEIRL
jgi:hypothetical protein